jgi:hypothetical protein
VTIVSTTIGLLVKLYQALDFLTSFGGLTGANPKWMAKETDKVTKAAVTTGKVQAKTATTLTKATKANTAELKKQAAAKKQNALFDIDQIQIVAALQGKISEEEKLRLRLQLALITGNEAQAAKLSAELATSIDKTGNLAKFLTTLPEANNPFKNWDAYLIEIEKKIRSLDVPMPNAPGSSIPALSGTDFGGNKIGSPVGGFTPPPAGTYGSQPTQVNSNLDGKTLLSAILDQSLSGNQSYVNRRTGGFE